MAEGVVVVGGGGEEEAAGECDEDERLVSGRSCEGAVQLERAG